MRISATTNLVKKLTEQLPQDLFNFIQKAGVLAQQKQQRLYLVGGAVRDLLLGKSILDIDLVIEGDAIKIAQEMASINKADFTPHPRFGTATIQWRNRCVDVVTARTETYTRPGALPEVRPGTIKDDLARRDFTVNSMAVELNPLHFGELIDPHQGRQDIKKKLIRILHNRSFIDDATRIWRAVRYEQRLDFSMEPATLDLLKRNIDKLDTVTGDRIRHELELTLKEEFPEKFLHRAGELGVLSKIHPSLKWDDWLTETFTTAAEKCLSDKPHPHLYLALLCYRLTETEIEKLVKYLHFPKAAAQVLRDTVAIKTKITALAAPGLAPSIIYELLHGYGLLAIDANQLAAGSETAAEHIELYLNVLRHVNPSLTGEDLIKLGIPQGQQIKQMLQKLREARLDGNISSKEKEEKLVTEWMGKQHN